MSDGGGLRGGRPTRPESAPSSTEDLNIEVNTAPGSGDQRQRVNLQTYAIETLVLYCYVCHAYSSSFLFCDAMELHCLVELIRIIWYIFVQISFYDYH